MLGTFNNWFSNESVYGWGDLCTLQRDALFCFFNQLTFWPCRVFAAVCGLSLVVVGQGLQARGLQESRLMGSAAQALKLWLVDFSCSLH